MNLAPESWAGAGRLWLVLGAAAGFTAVALGAFGAHGLKSRVEPDLVAIFETGARYHMYHAFALITCAWLAARSPTPDPIIGLAGWAFTTGIVLFSGSLYVLVLTGVRSWGAITPFGGLAFLTGWGALAWAAWRQGSS